MKKTASYCIYVDEILFYVYTFSSGRKLRLSVKRANIKMSRKSSKLLLSWYSKTRVTSYEFSSCELRVESLKAWDESLKAQVKIQKCEFKSTSYEFESTSYEFEYTSYEFEYTSYKFESTSYEFESTCSRIIKSMKTHVNSLQIYTRN